MKNKSWKLVINQIRERWKRSKRKDFRLFVIFFFSLSLALGTIYDIWSGKRSSNTIEQNNQQKKSNLIIRIAFWCDKRSTFKVGTYNIQKPKEKKKKKIYFLLNKFTCCNLQPHNNYWPTNLTNWIVNLVKQMKETVHNLTERENRKISFVLNKNFYWTTSTNKTEKPEPNNNIKRIRE